MRVRPTFIPSALLTLVVLLFGAHPSFAVVTPVTVYNSFGPGNIYSTAVDWAVGGAAAPSAYRGQAEFFVPGISGNLSTIQLATVQLSGSHFSNFFIAQDNGSGIPGTILESFLNVQNANGLLLIASVAQPLLQSGQKYWLCDEPAAANSYNGWSQNNQGVANGFGFERGQWSWESFGPPGPPSGVFKINVTPVPEPSVIGLVLPGVGLFVRRLRNGAALTRLSSKRGAPVRGIL
jgi:hypothetical protein